ncbi:MAG: radical SAM protein [Thermodesulfobacteriota bacterium]|nr:radical SAM protein [Thermodesulfobacteriota bacterium]
MLFQDTNLADLSYEIGTIRPPSEGGSYSLLIRVTRNCPWNQCTFCYGRPYNHEKFKMRSLEEVKADIDTVWTIQDQIKKISWQFGYGGGINNELGAALIREIPGLSRNHSFINVFNWMYSGARTAFLQDADSLIVPTSQLVKIIEYMKERFPSINRVTSYARAKTLYKKKDQELEELQKTGLSRLHIGLETGDDELLKKVKKGVSAKEHIQAGKKVKKSGIELSEYIMPGLGGRNMLEQHAKNTARVLSEINPDFIRSRPFTPIPGTPLFDEYTNGELELLSPYECLKEMEIFIKDLDVTSRVCFDHFRNPAYRTGSGHLYHLFKQDYDGYKFPEEKGVVLNLIKEGLSVDEGRYLQQQDYIRLGSL